MSRYTNTELTRLNGYKVSMRFKTPHSVLTVVGRFWFDGYGVQLRDRGCKILSSPVTPDRIENISIETVQG